MNKKYILQFFPEYFATSLWSCNENAKKNFGLNIQYNILELSSELIKRLEHFDNRVMDIIDWSDPLNNSPMSLQERQILYKDGKMLIQDVIKELGDDFEVIDVLDWIKPD